MDESKEYIEMCRKATEIQKAWQPHWGDFIEGDNDGVVTIISVGQTTYIMYILVESQIVWLPRQDQLQGMLKDYDKWTPLYWIRRFKGFSQSLYNSWEIERLETMTMDKLWLMFVMRENFKKKWDGKEWIDSAIFPADSL